LTALIWHVDVVPVAVTVEPEIEQSPEFTE
jgi:hypothetical protein